MSALSEQLEGIMPVEIVGSVARTAGMTASVAGFPAPVGSLVAIDRDAGGPLEAEVIGFRDNLTLIYPFSELTGIRRGNRCAHGAYFALVGVLAMSFWAAF